MNLKFKNIIQFLESRGWTVASVGNNFIYYTPPFGLDLPNGYLFQVPKDEQKDGFQEFCQRIISILVDIYEEEFTEDDLRIIFSSYNSVLSFRIADSDTQKGDIKLSRVKLSIDGLHKILQQTVTFISTKSPIFGNAPKEVVQYLDACRYLQTQKGSFITKIELPSVHINLFEEILVGDKLIDILEFITKEGTVKNISDIDEDYVRHHKDLINIELFTAIYSILKNVKITSANVSILTRRETKKLDIGRIAKKLSHFNLYIKKVKDILLKEVPLEIIGSVYLLQSKNSEYGGDIIVKTEISNEKQIIKISLNTVHYELAIEAHKNNLKVQVKGIAKQGKEYYYIEKVDTFELAT